MNYIEDYFDEHMHLRADLQLTEEEVRDLKADPHNIKAMTQMIFRRAKENGNNNLREEDIRTMAYLNKGAVHYVAQRFQKSDVLQNMQYDDLVQVGNLGLLKAIQKYDIDNKKAATFFTYCQYWIYAEIERFAFVNRSLIYVPYKKRNDISYKRFDIEDDVFGRFRTDPMKKQQLLMSAESVRPLIRQCLSADDYELISTRYGFGEGEDEVYGDEKTYRELAAITEAQESKLRYATKRIQKKLKVHMNAMGIHRPEDVIDIEEIE